MKPYPKPLLTDGAFLIDNSTYESLLTCDRSAEYLIGHKRIMNGERAALNFGAGVHCAMEIRSREQNNALHHSEFENSQIERLITYFADKPNDDTDYRTADYAIQLVQEYNKAYPVACEPFKTYERDCKSFVELPFALPLGVIEVNDVIDGQFYASVPIIWTGRLDSVVVKSGEYWIRDYKTSSIFGPKFFDDFILSGQMMGYTWATQQLIGCQVQGAMIDALIVRRPTKTGKGMEFARAFQRYSQQSVNEWRINTLHVVADFFAHGKRDYFPMKTKWCNGKYGACPYSSVCQQDSQFRDITLESNLYEDQEWSPLNERN